MTDEITCREVVGRYVSLYVSYGGQKHADIVKDETVIELVKNNDPLPDFESITEINDILYCMKQDPRFIYLFEEYPIPMEWHCDVIVRRFIEELRLGNTSHTEMQIIAEAYAVAARVMTMNDELFTQFSDDGVEECYPYEWELDWFRQLLYDDEFGTKMGIENKDDEKWC